MAKKLRSPKKKSLNDGENVCSYCLFFQQSLVGRRPLQGNCCYFKEWIDNASLTTCSDMSAQPLKEKGIYQLVANGDNEPVYVRREHRVRTRLFLVK